LCASLHCDISIIIDHTIKEKYLPCLEMYRYVSKALCYWCRSLSITGQFYFKFFTIMRQPVKQITQTQEELVKDFLKETQDLRMLFPNLLEIRLNLKSLLADFLLLNSNTSTQVANQQDIEKYGFTVSVLCDLFKTLET
jgi:hypothetical protein